MTFREAGYVAVGAGCYKRAVAACANNCCDVAFSVRETR
jgi:hypothetical protein